MFALILSFSVRMSHSDTDLKARVQAMSLVDLHKKLDGAKVCLLYCCYVQHSHRPSLHSAHVLCQLRADIIGISMGAEDARMNDVLHIRMLCLPQFSLESLSVELKAGGVPQDRAVCMLTV